MKTFGWLAALLLVMGAAAAQDAPIYEPMPLVDEHGQDIVNVLLVGLATENIGAAGLTDTMMIVSFNRQARHASIVSVPRDLYVYVPVEGMMTKLNQAYYFGEKNPDDGVTGMESLKQTILYNLGVQIDYTAMVNFNGFKRLIDSLGGVEISVDCAIQDWRLISPELDRNVAENYAKFTLEAGVHLLDGDTALWYVRSRKTSSDLDRGRRQQDVLRAIWRTLRARGTLEALPILWEQWDDLVKTDMPLDVALGLLPDVIGMDTADVSYYTFRIRQEVSNGYTPDAQQRYILVPDREAVYRLMQNVVAPATASQLAASIPTVAVVNATGTSYYDYLARIAADRLELEGFRTTIIQEAGQARQYNHIIDYTGQDKGSPLERLMKVLSTTAEGVRVEPDPQRTVDYKVLIGQNYAYYACTRPVLPPTPEQTPTPNG